MESSRDFSKRNPPRLASWSVSLVLSTRFSSRDYFGVIAPAGTAGNVVLEWWQACIKTIRGMALSVGFVFCSSFPPVGVSRHVGRRNCLTPETFSSRFGRRDLMVFEVKSRLKYGMGFLTIYVWFQNMRIQCRMKNFTVS